MKLTKINTRLIFTLTATALIAGNSAFAQLGQSDWQTPGGGSTGSSNSAPAQGLGQSDWQTPSGNSSGGQSQLGQSGWQQPPGQQQQQPFQQPVQQQQPQQLGQSNWQQPASSNQLGQSDWQQPAAPAGNQLGQSGWQQPAPASKPLQGSASTTTTLGDALQAGQGNSANSDIDPAAAAMMMNQLNGGANGAGANMGAAGGAMNPAAMMMGGGMNGGMSGADPMAAMSQLAPALGALMMVMPNNNNGMNMGMPSSRPFTGGFAVPRRGGTVYNNNSGGIGNTVNRIVPPSMVQSMMRQMMYQGMSRAMYH